TFANPLEVRAADPEVLFDGGVYYMYATSEAGRGFVVWTSRDLVTWRPRGLAFAKTAGGWGQRDFWAPSIVKAGGRYLLYYNAQPGDAPQGSARGHRICVAEADNPLGPFRDVAAPLFDPGSMAIDADIFVDEDGKGYLYYANGSIWVVPLDASLTKVVGEPVLCLEPKQVWEQKWNEAPHVIRHDKKYILFYSAPGYDMPEYSVAYAVADSPMGPWLKPHASPILSRTPLVSGPGHNAITTSPDGRELWMVYHTHQQLSGGDPRQIAIDRVRIVDDPSFGVRVEVDGPTTLLQTLPSGAVGPYGAKSDEFDGQTLDRARWSIVNERAGAWRLESGRLVVTTHNGDVWGARYDLKNLFLQTPPAGDFEIVTKINFRVQQNYDQVFLVIWQDHNNYVRLGNVYAGGRRWQMVRELGGRPEQTLVPNTIGDDVWMKITRRGRSYECAVSVDGKAWWPVGPPMAADFSEVQVGLGAASPGGGRKAKAAFEFFRYRPLPARGGGRLGEPSVPKP
ncbi:hypothetical protein MNBD_PLANCTO03-1396, partial [hydrothermal vent metagenome]